MNTIINIYCDEKACSDGRPISFSAYTRMGWPMSAFVYHYRSLIVKPL